MQQLCRFFGNYVEETIRDLQNHGQQFMSEWENSWSRRHQQPGPQLNEAFENLCLEWKEALKSQEAQLNVTLARVQKKKEDVEILRDGVSTFTTIHMYAIDFQVAFQRIIAPRSF